MSKTYNFIKKSYNAITTFIIFLIAWFFGGIVGGLGILLTIVFSLYGFVYAAIIAILFVPFHFYDLKSFYLNKNWFAFIGRIIVVYLIGAFIGGFIGYRSGLMEMPTNTITAWIFFVGTIISWIAIGFFLVVTHFFSESSVLKKIKEMYRGLSRVGVLWF